MSWEVSRNMRCETSFFSLTLYKKHLKRYWPLWAAWLGLWTLAMPMQTWNMGTIYRRQDGTRYLEEYLERAPLEALNLLFPLLAVLAAIVAAAVLFHLFKSPAANFIGALPMRREGVFATALAAGYTMMVGPLVVVSLLLLAVEAALGTVAVGPVFAFLGAGALNSFFWLCFATLCCVISGHAVAGVVFYGIFNFIVPVMTTLVEGLLSGFLYGFAGFSDGFYEVANWLCPVGKLTRQKWWWEKMDWEMLAIYAAVGFLMLLASIGLHHIRKAERAGDLIAFDPVKWLFKVCVTICGGIGFGTFFTVVIFNSVDLTEGWRFGVCCAVAAFLCYMVSEMLLAKSFKVWKHWKGAAISAVAFLLVVAAVDMDWIGFTTRIPAPESVKRATVYFDGTDMGTTASNGLDFTGEDVKAITGLHQYLVEHRDTDVDYKDKYLSVQIRYDLGWTSIQRKYTARYDAGDALSQTLDRALGAGTVTFPSERGIPSELYGELEVPVQEAAPQVTHGAGADAVATEETEFMGVTVETKDIEAVWDAVRRDAEEGRLTPRPTAEKGKSPQGTLHAYWNIGERFYRYQTDLHEGMTATWSALKERGYLAMLED